MADARERAQRVVAVELVEDWLRPLADELDLDVLRVGEAHLLADRVLHGLRELVELGLAGCVESRVVDLKRLEVYEVVRRDVKETGQRLPFGCRRVIEVDGVERLRGGAGGLRQQVGATLAPCRASLEVAVEHALRELDEPLLLLGEDAVALLGRDARLARELDAGTAHLLGDRPQFGIVPRHLEVDLPIERRELGELRIELPCQRGAQALA